MIRVIRTRANSISGKITRVADQRILIDGVISPETQPEHFALHP